MKSFKYFCTLLLAALTFAACSNEEIVEPEPNQQPVGEGIPFKAVFGVKNGTSRALTDPGDGTLTASWAVGEEIAIVFGGNKYTATVTEVDEGGNAIVSGTLPSSTPHNQAVTFIYPASAADGSGLRSDLLASQDGTLATISSSLDVATAEGSIIIVDGKAQPNGTVTLENQFAICKFSFKDESDQPIEDIIKVKIIDLSTDDVINVTPATPLSAIYVAMLPSQNTTKFRVTKSNGDAYVKTSNAHMQAGKFYRPTFRTTFDIYARPLTFEAISDGPISFSNKASNPVSYSIYSSDGSENSSGTINASSSGRISLTAGQKVCFYGDNSTYATSNTNSRFTIKTNCYVYGNIMSLIDSNDYPDLKELTEEYTFRLLFTGIDQLMNHPDKQLLLPATTLTNNCYYSMFYFCTSLTKAPDLPATTLAERCYGRMFYGCSSLTTAPALPATTLASRCYDSMFYECSNLTTAPELPATTLAERCYINMFWGCTNLNSVKCLATDRSASFCTEDWLSGVAATGTFTKAEGATWPSGVNGIPDGWTVIEE